MPPPSVSPPTPVVEMMPPVVARPCGVGGVVERAPGRAALRPRGLPGRVDLDLLHALEVDHDRVLAGAEARDAVRAAADRDVEPVLPRVVDGGHDVVGPGRPHDDVRVPVDHRVVDATRLVVVGVPRGDRLAPNLLAEPLHGNRRHPSPPMVVPRPILLRRDGDWNRAIPKCPFGQRGLLPARPRGEEGEATSRAACAAGGAPAGSGPTTCGGPSAASLRGGGRRPSRPR